MSKYPAARLYPSIMYYWDYDRNESLGIKDTIGSRSSTKAYFRCDRGEPHSYFSEVYRRIYGEGCSYCSGNNTLRGFNDMWTTVPEIAYQLVFPSIGYENTLSSNTKQWWYCDNKHSWFTSPNARSRLKDGKRVFSGCPFCGGARVWVGFNDYHTTNPDKSKYLLNRLDGYKYSRGSGEIVWWTCGSHKWKSTFRDVTHGNFCPECSNSISKPEKLLAELLPESTSQYKVRSRFNVDLYLDDFNTVVEYDGGRWHTKKYTHDTSRTIELLGLGFKVVRVREQSKWFTLDRLDIDSENLLQIDFKHDYKYSGLAEVAENIKEWLEND